MYKQFSCEKIGSKEVECKSLIQPSHLRSLSYNDFRENPKCTRNSGASGWLDQMIGMARMFIEDPEGPVALVKIPELYNGKKFGMGLKLVNGKIVGADNTIFNGTCIDEKALDIYAEVRNPAIEGKIDLV